jgi:hypothetical protein
VMNVCDLGKPRKVDCLSGAVEAFLLPIALRGTKTQDVSGGTASGTLPRMHA